MGELDIHGDGIPDLTTYDTNGDGYDDQASDGAVTYTNLNAAQDTQFETMTVDNAGDENWEVMSQDTTGDGVHDVRFTRSGTLTTFERLDANGVWQNLGTTDSAAAVAGGATVGGTYDPGPTAGSYTVVSRPTNLVSVDITLPPAGSGGPPQGWEELSDLQEDIHNNRLNDFYPLNGDYNKDGTSNWVDPPYPKD